MMTRLISLLLLQTCLMAGESILLYYVRIPPPEPQSAPSIQVNNLLRKLNDEVIFLHTNDNDIIDWLHKNRPLRRNSMRSVLRLL